MTEQEKKIILTFNDKGDTAYIHLKESLMDMKIGESKKQVVYDGFDSEEAKNFKVELILDVNENGKIIGIEILTNRDIIPDELK